MKVKVTHNSVELKLSLRDVDNLRAIADTASANQYAYLTTIDHAAILSKKLKDALEAANKLNWMDGV